MNKYELADGSFSDQYKVGDKFKVLVENEFAKGSIVSLYDSDGSYCPRFKLVEGMCSWKNCDGEWGAFESWEYLTPLVNKPHLRIV